MPLSAAQKRNQESEEGAPHLREPRPDPVRFALVCSILLAVVALVPDCCFDPLNHATACLAGMCLALFGGHANVSGDLISLDGFQVRIITECTALYSILVFGSFLISVSASFKARLVGLAFGAAFLSCVNLLRIAAVVGVGASRPVLFEIFHVYLGQVVMVVMVIAACLAWLQNLNPQRLRLGTFNFLVRFGACSSLIFLVWFVLNVDYVRLIDLHVIRQLFSWWMFSLEIPYQHMIYYQTFNVVAFIGLVMAGGGKALRGKVRTVALGLAGIVGMHILFRVCNVLTTGFGMGQVGAISQAVYLTSQFMIPVLLWMVTLGQERTGATEKAG